MDARTSLPLISVCIPTYNGARWLEEAVNSALGQTYEHIEILIVDDGSSDSTVEVARSFRDERVRVVASAHNRGLAGNWNECVRLARGRYVKFLFQDDLLRPDCVEKMARLFETHEGLGLVFSPREVVVESDVGHEEARSWLEEYATLHTRFKVSPGVNDGRALFAEHLRQEFTRCCVGEPTTVLIRKSCFGRLGLFNTRMHQACDIEMWLRIMYFYDIGFVDEKLSTYRVHAGSATSANQKRRRDAFDMFWLLEGLLAHDEIRRGYPEIKRMRDEQLRHQSLLRPGAGWRSLRTAEGRREALNDAANWPRRARFLISYMAYRLRGSSAAGGARRAASFD